MTPEYPGVEKLIFYKYLKNTVRTCPMCPPHTPGIKHHKHKNFKYFFLILGRCSCGLYPLGVGRGRTNVFLRFLFIKFAKIAN